MTINEYLHHIEICAAKIRNSSDGDAIQFTLAECNAMRAALEIAGGICDILAEDAKPRGEKNG